MPVRQTFPALLRLLAALCALALCLPLGAEEVAFVTVVEANRDCDWNPLDDSELIVRVAIGTDDSVPLAALRDQLASQQPPLVDVQGVLADGCLEILAFRRGLQPVSARELVAAALIAAPATPAVTLAQLAFQSAPRLPVAVWNLVQPFCRVVDAIGLANETFTRENLGLELHWHAFDLTEHSRFAGEHESLDFPPGGPGNIDFHMLPSDPVLARAQLAELDELKLPRLTDCLNVYFVRGLPESKIEGSRLVTGQGQYFDQGGGLLVLGGTASPSLLTHEVGHAIFDGFCEVNSTLVDILATMDEAQALTYQRNVMNKRPDARRVLLTEGQVYRAHFRAGSILHTLYHEADVTRPEPRQTSDPRNPPMTLRCWEDVEPPAISVEPYDVLVAALGDVYDVSTWSQWFVECGRLADLEDDEELKERLLEMGKRLRTWIEHARVGDRWLLEALGTEELESEVRRLAGAAIRQRVEWRAQTAVEPPAAIHGVDWQAYASCEEDTAILERLIGEIERTLETEVAALLDRFGERAPLLHGTVKTAIGSLRDSSPEDSGEGRLAELFQRTADGPFLPAEVPEDPNVPLEPEDPSVPLEPEDPNTPLEPEDPEKPLEPEKPGGAG